MKMKDNNSTTVITIVIETRQTIANPKEFCTETIEKKYLFTKIVNQTQVKSLLKKIETL